MQSEQVLNHWGAVRLASGAVRFRLWASGQQQITVRVNGNDHPMQELGNGAFELTLHNLPPGTTYHYLLADGTAVPDPASRAQQGDVNGPSLLVDTHHYRWQHNAWRGRPWEETVVYELHIGTFTPEGTFHAAMEKLPYLAELGITQIEVMPVSQSGGSRNWGYDGVLLYAPHSAYGTPDDFKAFIDAAHGLGLSVVLDIVLNHFGPEGNFLPRLSPDFFDPHRMTPWGHGIAYDLAPVREFIIGVPLYWLSEYRLDGLRFDAIDQMEDRTEPHILIEIAERIRATITNRPVHLTTEDSRNVIYLHPRDERGAPPLFTAEWNDDLHNALHVFATGETHAYYQDFANAPQAWLAHALTEGFAYQGQIAPHTGKPRGIDSRGQPPAAFVDFIQNHDQVGNRAQGERLITLTGEAKARVLLAMLLLSPHIPLLFMGEEYGETHPFLFFTDFHGDLARAVREGRANEFAGHNGHDAEDVPDPNAQETFTRSKLDWQKLTTRSGKSWLRFTRQLVLLRQRAIVPLLANAQHCEGEVLHTEPGHFAVCWRFATGTLSMALNISDQIFPVELPGEPLFVWPEGAQSLSPDSIIVCFDKGETWR